MKSQDRFRGRPLASLAFAAIAIAFPAAANASTTYGELTNFDVFNDTGDDCHGFEIELEGLDPSDVVYTFGAPYERYGNPEVVAFAGGVYVRYASAYDPGSSTWAAATPQAPAVITPTNGHACWTGGSGDYLTSGCEHFGVSLAKGPTNTVYRWLVADPLNPGQLKRADTKVNIPAPVWNVSPPPPQAPDQQHPVVAAVIEPPDPVAYEFGDALWMKVFVTEGAEPADLDHLVSEDPRVPEEPAEVETEWVLLQKENGKPAEFESSGQSKEGSESVTRRYEFYEYTGPYDPENHEAQPTSDSSPADGEIGNYIGAQMAAVNFDPAVIIGGTTTTTTTTTSTSSTSTSTTTLVGEICGDANADGKLTSSDALAALRSAVGLSSSCTLAVCDTDSNGMMQASDALRILKAAVGQPVPLDCTF